MSNIKEQEQKLFNEAIEDFEQLLAAAPPGPDEVETCTCDIGALMNLGCKCGGI